VWPRTSAVSITASRLGGMQGSTFTWSTGVYVFNGMSLCWSLPPLFFTLAVKLDDKSEEENAADVTAGGSSAIQELLKCFICFERVREPRMCPTCSKICCLQCISRWLTERKSQCPHCRSALHIQSLVNCRFMDDVSQVRLAEREREQKSKEEEKASYILHVYQDG
jgi:hypothetical protein